MADHKFQKDLDRQAVPLDFKNRIIDLTQNNFTAPECGIYDEPVRYLKMNEEWFAIFAGWLAWMETTAFWKDAEDDNYVGIQAIRTFEEGIEPMSMDYEALQQAIHDAMYEVVNNVAKQIVSGRINNISVDEDGTVSDPSSDPSSDLPPDDPETPINELDSALSGQVLAVALGINEFLGYVHTLFGTDSTADNPIDDAQILVKARYISIVPVMDDALEVYWAARALSQAQITTVDREDLAAFLFCRPYGDLWNNVAAFIAGLPSFDADQKQIAIGIISGLDEQQWNIWSRTGSAAPSLEYLDYPCVKSAPETLLMPVLGTAYTTATSWKAGHRLKLTITGFFSDTTDTPVNDIRDFWWYRQGSTSQLFFQGANNNIQLGTGIVKPSSNQVPYNNAHSYVCTIDTPLGSGGQMIITIPSTSMTTPVTSTNGFTVLIEDMGQVV